MSRRRTVSRWSIGDQVRIPRFSQFRMNVTWSRATVVAIRGDHVLVEQYGHVFERPAYELRPLIHRRFCRELEEAYRAGARS